MTRKQAITLIKVAGYHEDTRMNSREDTIMNQIVLQKIENLGPCAEALHWLRTQSSPEAAWKGCERGDWMLWLVGKLSGPPDSDSRKLVVTAAVECTRFVLPYSDDKRVLVCIKTTERYLAGKATLSEVRNA